MAFTVGELYSNAEISTGLGVGNAGGLRAKAGSDGDVRRLVLMTAKPTTRQARENPYHDRVEGSVLIYTGAGLEGDQTLGGMNQRLPQQAERPFPIYGFQQVASRRDRSIGPQRWRFLGLLQYLRHYCETQIDNRGNARSVWIFELRIHEEPAVVPPDHDEPLAAVIAADSPLDGCFDPEEREIDSASGAAAEASDSIDPAGLEAVRRELLAGSPQEFEGFVGRLLAASGYEQVCVTRMSQDGGVDVEGRAGPELWPIHGQLVQVQAKRWLHTVGRREVAELRGSLKPHASGAIITTSHYSKAAVREASEPGRLPIVLVDGYRLAKIAVETGLVELSPVEG